MKYRADIDGLRAVAVIPVVLFHAKVPGFTGGYVGVDVFFVISGYLITGILLSDIRNDKFSILRFYERRIRRIFPALFGIVLFCVMVSFAIMLPADIENFGRSVIAVTFFASNILFSRQGGYFDRPVEEELLLHTWSLAVEEQFYIVFPIYLFLVWRFMKPRRAVIATVGVLALSFAISVWQVRAAPTDAFFLAPARIWELLLGSCLAMGFMPRARAPLVHQALPVIGTGLIAWSVVAYSPATPFPGLHALCPCLGAVLIIYSGTFDDSAVRRILSTTPFVFVGKISYSLYLWHWPLLGIAEYYLIREMTSLETWLVILLSVILATASWRFIEMPFRGSNPVLRRNSLFAAAATVMAATAAIGAAIVVTEGLPGRLPPEVAQLAAGARDKPPRRDECNHRSANDVEQRKLCRIGAGGASNPSFVVWGDSHAEALFPIIDRTAAQSGRSGLFITRAGCPSLFGVVQARRPRYDEPCFTFGRAVEDLLISMPSIDTVILSSRWTIYAIGERYKGEKGNIVYIKDRESQEFSIQENRRVFQDGLQRTIARLKELGKNVVIVAQVPEVGWYVPSVLARAKLVNSSLDLSPKVADYFERQGFINKAFGEAKHTYDVIVLYPHEYLCSKDSCRITAAGKSLYYDSNHLSVFGTELLTDMFRPIFK